VPALLDGEEALAVQITGPGEELVVALGTASDRLLGDAATGGRVDGDPSVPGGGGGDGSRPTHRG